MKPVSDPSFKILVKKVSLTKFNGLIDLIYFNYCFFVGCFGIMFW